MQHIKDLKEVNLDRSWLTIGTFDGVHLGHQQIITALVKGARAAGLPSVVVTFFPHPQLVLQEQSRPFYLTLPETRARLLAELGVDYVYTWPFDLATSQLSARQFVGQLSDHFHFEHLLIGYDFALGKNREGNAEVLRSIGVDYGYSVDQIPPYRFKGSLVSSSRIRQELRAGNVREAAALLGRDFEVSGEVIKGDDRGKSLGFATCNLAVHPELVDIKPGVYACQAVVEGKTWMAVTNIGFRPTFGDDLKSPRIEAHLLDFSGDLYGQRVRLSFVARLRDEMKFSEVSDLIAQIQHDVAQTRQILSQL
ncbi:MAG: bifunctional riboflavin kinase/FAD synthetase [Anaerolineales bacterium]|jgi:riboflavin kinase/FMN adenylyltransferase